MMLTGSDALPEVAALVAFRDVEIKYIIYIIFEKSHSRSIILCCLVTDKN